MSIHLLTRNAPIEIGDILYTTVGATYGNPAVVNTKQKFCFQRHIAHLKPDYTKISTFFLFSSLKSKMAKRQADNLVKGAAQKTLNLGELNKVKIFLPPLNVQKHFSGIAENIESQKVKAEASLQKSEALFNSLLQRAFRGELFAEGVEREETAAGPIAAGAAQLKLF